MTGDCNIAPGLPEIVGWRRPGGRGVGGNGVAKEDTGTRQDSFVDLLATVYPRVVALFLIYFALRYWMQLIGLHEGAEFRFDTMSAHWRAAAASLAVLMPVAAVGMWCGFSWGIVVWLLAAGAESLMYFWFADLFGRSAFTVAFHLVTVAGYAGLRLATSRFVLARK